MMRIDPQTIRETVTEAIQAFDAALIETAARVADAEANRLEMAADMEVDTARKELLAAARAARDVAAGIRKLTGGLDLSQATDIKKGA